MEKFSSSVAAVASGTNKTIINLFHAAAVPTCRGKISFLAVGSVATPADQAADFFLGRTTGIGTEGAGFVPANLDPAGPAGEMDSGNAHSVEPTYTASKELFHVPGNQRATLQAFFQNGFELMLTATQNNGGGFKTLSSTSTQTHGATIFHEE